MKTRKILIGLITTSFILFSFPGIKGQNNDNKIKNDLSELKLKGKVKTLKEASFSESDMLVSTYVTIPKGDTLDNTNLFFDEIGNKIEENSSSFTGSMMSSKFTFKYDDKGNTFEKSCYNFDGSLSSKHTYKYDDKGNQIEDNIYDSNGSLSEKHTYKYDDKRNQIEQSGYGSDGLLFEKHTYKYNDKGYQIEESVYNSDGSLSSKRYYKYDDKGNQIEDSGYGSDNIFLEKFTFQYDNKGNQIEVNSYGSDGIIAEKHTYNYDYDAAGNWIKKTTIEVGTPSDIKKRVIEYY